MEKVLEHVSDNLSVEIIPDGKFEFLMTTNEVAKGFGVAGNTVRMHKLEHKDEKEEKEKLIKEKEAKIDQLQTELREKSEELAALKAFQQHSHSHGHHDQPDNTEGIHKGLGR